MDWGTFETTPMQEVGEGEERTEFKWFDFPWESTQSRGWRSSNGLERNLVLSHRLAHYVSSRLTTNAPARDPSPLTRE